MIVAHVLSSLQIGGAERMALELAAGQVEARHDVMVVSLESPPDGPLGDRFRERGVGVQGVVKRSGADITLSLRLAALFRRNRVDVVHTHNRLPLDLRGGRGQAGGREGGAHPARTGAGDAARAVADAEGRLPDRRVRRGVAGAGRAGADPGRLRRRQAEGDRERRRRGGFWRIGGCAGRGAR